MAQISLQFDVSKEALTEGTARQIRERLKAVEGVTDADAVIDGPEKAFGVAEVLLVISATVVIVKSGTELVEALRKLTGSLAGLIRDVKGLKAAFVEVRGKRVVVGELTEEKIQELASAKA
jgi:hypothetical protein